ncbi:MAG: hypothetical protein KN64_05715 [Sulfurovum sp. AS07-7]|nr:MAG: hypothetical protein KN64_05715 [Sulfurovum sp. AS07-7]
MSKAEIISLKENSKEVIKGDLNKKYLIVDAKTGKSFNKIFIKKNKKNLEIYSNENDTTPDLIIEDYQGEELLGVTEGGEEFAYIKESYDGTLLGENVTSLVLDSNGFGILDFALAGGLLTATGVGIAGSSRASSNNSDVGGEKIDNKTYALDLIKESAQKDTATLNVENYTQAGVEGITEENVNLMNETLNTIAVDGGKVDTLEEIQALADAINAVTDTANDIATSVTNEQFELLGITGVSDENLSAVLGNIESSDKSGVDTLAKIQALVDESLKSLEKIVESAENNETTTITLSDFTHIGVEGVTSDNLNSINDVLEQVAVDGVKVDSKEEIQAIVDSFNGILSLADASDNSSFVPTTQDYLNIGVTGIDSKAKELLLADVIDIKSQDDVDSVTKVQELSDAVKAVMDTANGLTPSVTKEQLELLGITGVSDENLDEIVKLLQESLSDGNELDSLSELQGIVKNVNEILIVIANEETQKALDATQEANDESETAQSSSDEAEKLADDSLATAQTAQDSITSADNATLKDAEDRASIAVDKANEYKTLAEALVKEAVAPASSALNVNPATFVILSPTVPLSVVRVAVGVVGGVLSTSIKVLIVSFKCSIALFLSTICTPLSKRVVTSVLLSNVVFCNS